ncbi:hypothetical protein I546_3255 [Mycobacterium kansasii 732]|nr:hypothetical protein I546_3255 [Mycobacterium kansasii 732]
MTELVVNTAHLQQLAAQHDTLAGEIAAATRVTHGIGQDVLIRHGVSSGFSNHAVAQAQVAATPQAPRCTPRSATWPTTSTPPQPPTTPPTTTKLTTSSINCTDHC